MRNWIGARLSRKIVFSVSVVVCLLMTALVAVTLQNQSRALERRMFEEAKTDALVGAEAMGSMLEGLVREGAISEEELFDTNYRLITSGPLAGGPIPKYHTAYDEYLDDRIREIEDSFLVGSSVVYAVLVDRNGYLPTHNSRYSKPMLGNDKEDIVGNRTKRLFADPVGLNAAHYTAEDGQPVLRQVYKRDTGVTMWDVTAPVVVHGRHWGGFRIGLSMRYINAQIAARTRTILIGLALLIVVASATIWLTVHSSTRRLANFSCRLDEFSREGQFKQLDIVSPDEIGTLAGAFNRMVDSLASVTVSRDYLNRILDSMNDSLMVVSASGMILKVNRATCELLDYPKQELLQMGVGQVIPDPDADQDSWFDYVIASRDGEQVELDFITRSGLQIPVLFSSAPLVNEGHASDSLICMARDITDRKIAEEKIRNSQLFLETVLDSLNEEMTILDAKNLTILKANKAFAEAHQTTPAVIVGQKCHKITHGLDHPCGGIDHPCPVMDILEFGRADVCEHEHQNEDGESRFVEVQVTPVLDESESPRYLIHMARDITNRKIAELDLQNFAHELEKNNRTLAEKSSALEAAHAELKASQSRILQQEKMASIGQLSAGVAHEINNPIGFIISNLTTLGKYAQRLTDYLDEQERLWREQGQNEIGLVLAEKRKQLKIDYIARDLYDLVDESLEGADRVKKIVLDLKGFSRIDDSDCKEVDLHECLESTINIAWNEIKYKATLTKDFGDIPRLRCYPQQLNQVFMNLLVNAAHAIEEKGHIEVKTHPQGEGIQIDITDSGCGMSEEVRNRIFEPFYTTKAVGKGTGLGLSISYDIIKNHHGEIRVQSAPGQGTTFRIYLPLHVEEAVAC